MLLPEINKEPFSLFDADFNRISSGLGKVQWQDTFNSRMLMLPTIYGIYLRLFSYIVEKGETIRFEKKELVKPFLSIQNIRIML